MNDVSAAAIAGYLADISRQLAERNVRTYSLDEVAEMTGFALRKLELNCRRGDIEHTYTGKSRRMTLDQIDLLVAAHKRGVTRALLLNEALTEAEALQEAREQSRRAATRCGTRWKAR